MGSTDESFSNTVQRGLQGFSQERSSTACTMEQNVDIPVPGGSLHGLSVPGSSSSSAVSRDVRGEGFFFFALFPRFKKSATLPPRSGSALPPHSSPWTPAAYDVPMALEEEEESQEELDDDVEYMEFDGCWWWCEWVPARQQYCWWLAAADGLPCPLLRTTGTNGSRQCRDGLEVPQVQFLWLWTSL